LAASCPQARERDPMRTKPKRSWVGYDRKSHVGKLDKAWDEAVTKRWIVVSMKDDWKTIFPNAAK
jgi:hypothetical protein